MELRLKGMNQNKYSLRNLSILWKQSLFKCCDSDLGADSFWGKFKVLFKEKNWKLKLNKIISKYVLQLKPYSQTICMRKIKAFLEVNWLFPPI